jgi:hypothetical protein
MKDMKLIMESWKQFSENEIKEQLLREQFNAYLDENNIVLTEGELEEGFKSWAKKAVGTAGLAATLAGAGAPAMAQVASTTGPETTQQVTSVTMQDDALMTQQLIMKLMMVETTEEAVEIIKKIHKIQNDKDLQGEIVDALQGRGPQQNKIKDLGEIGERFKKPGQL